MTPGPTIEPLVNVLAAAIALLSVGAIFTGLSLLVKRWRRRERRNVSSFFTSEEP